MCAHLRERTTFFVPNCISDEKLTILPLTTPSICRGEMLLYIYRRRERASDRSLLPTGDHHTIKHSNNQRRRT